MRKYSRLDWLQAIAGLGSLLTAVIAIILALNSEERNAERFEMQLKEADRIARSSVRPLLSVRSLIYSNKKGIVLSNRGAGTAVLKDVKMVRGSRSARNSKHLKYLFYPSLRYNKLV